MIAFALGGWTLIKECIAPILGEGRQYLQVVALPTSDFPEIRAQLAYSSDDELQGAGAIAWSFRPQICFEVSLSTGGN